METPIGISRRVGLNTTSSVHTYSHSTPVAGLGPSSTGISTNEYSQFNLQNIYLQTPPKWKNNENILEDFKKFKWSCVCIFDGPVAHITNGKVKTNMFLIWVGSDAEDMYKNLHLSSRQQYDIGAVLEAFKRYCKPTCNC